jgi:uncharacterized protein (TIGR02466 family)
MEYLDLFPTRIYKFHINIDYNKIIDEIYLWEQDNKSENFSNYGGWQSDHELIFRFDKLHQKILKCFSQISNYNGMSINSGWANINKKGSFNYPHIHPRSYLSCAFYLKIPSECESPIIFQDPRIQKSITDYEDTCNFAIYPDVGDLIIFPSWMYHVVPPNESEEDRISISCNYG